MTVIDRYIARTVLRGVAMVVMVLLAVATFIDFVAQLDEVGTQEYGFPEALSYVALRVPSTIFNVLPAAALLGALLGLGNMAAHGELTVMRSSGISTAQLARSVAAAGLVLLLVMVLLGESFAPRLNAYARAARTEALHDGLDMANGSSAWLKDGDRILNLRQEGNGGGFGGVLLFDLGPEQTLDRVARADSAAIDAQNRWVLANYAETRFLPDRVVVQHQRQTRETYGVSLELLALSVVREDLLDTPALQRYISYLRANDLDARPYLIAYWSRMANVVSVLLMTVLALPFVLGGLRSAGAGARLLVGLLIGLGYYVASQTLANSGQVFDLDPRIVAWAPVAALLLAILLAFSRVR